MIRAAFDDDSGRKKPQAVVHDVPFPSSFDRDLALGPPMHNSPEISSMNVVYSQENIVQKRMPSDVNQEDGAQGLLPFSKKEIQRIQQTVQLMKSHDIPI